MILQRVQELRKKSKTEYGLEASEVEELLKEVELTHNMVEAMRSAGIFIVESCNNIKHEDHVAFYEEMAGSAFTNVKETEINGKN